ncbi:ecotin family protein [Vibrio splendidus]|nr:ecotin family protein [Vibrio splendidus]MCC4880451.1 ecotin family protein [Vibrio splendidus]
MKKSIITTLLLGAAMSVNAESLDDSMFPKATDDVVKHTFQIESLENERDAMIEIVVSKEIQGDCNKSFLMGELQEKNLDGWGYNYFEFTGDGGYAGTRMMCPEGEAKTVQKAYAHRQSLYQYNSKLPIVVYAKQNIDVEIRIWKPEA